MAFRSPEITIPNVRLSLDELLAVIQKLDEASRARIAQTLAEMEMDARVKAVVEELAERAPAEDITEADLGREVQAVRRALRPA